MAVLALGLVLLLAMATQSESANYCVCNTGLSDTVLQRDIDYACGNGADCSAIMQNGACYNPNTLRDHCNYAVNSYYQRRGQVSGSCDFTASATVVQTPPNAASGCVYQSSPSNGGSQSPPTAGGTPPNTGVGGTPPNTGIGGTPPNTGIGGTPPNSTGFGGTPPGTPPGSLIPGSSFSPPGIGLAPSGSGGFDNSASATLLSLTTLSMLVCLSLTPLLSGLMCQWI